MMMVYKLGDGPFNYDWNPRYVKIEGTELFYSPTPSDRDMKTINIIGGAVSSICNIKEKVSICITLPPPVNKSIFLATDSIQECLKLREKVSKATHNEVHTENYHSDVDEHLNNYTITKERAFGGRESIISVCLSKINKFNKFYSEEFLKRIERIKNEIVSVNTKYTAKLKGLIKIFVPSAYDYNNIIERLKSKISLKLELLFLLFILYLCDKFINHWIIMLGYYALIILMIKSFATKILYFDDECSYNVEAYTIINKPHTKLFELLDNVKSRKEWDHFIAKNSEITIYPEVICF
jgi:hypothetical protein